MKMMVLKFVVLDEDIDPYAPGALDHLPGGTLCWHPRYPDTMMRSDTTPGIPALGWTPSIGASLLHQGGKIIDTDESDDDPQPRPRTQQSVSMTPGDLMRLIAISQKPELITELDKTSFDSDLAGRW